jgi:CBS domain-containing protein
MNVEDEVQSSCGGEAPVTVYASDAVVTMPADATLQAVARELAEDEIGIVVIGSKDAVVGVVSERDVVRAVAASLDPAVTLAADVGSARIVWCDRLATVREVAQVMMEHYVRHVLLEEDARLVGIVSARDLLGAYSMTPQEASTTAT